LTNELSVSSVTQTWQVGRRTPSQRVRASESDSEQTLTICRPSLCLVAESPSLKVKSQELTLTNGLHSFWLDDKNQLQSTRGRDEKAEFEIDVNLAGSFYFATDHDNSVRVNGRKIGWVKLRSDDVIRLSDWTVQVRTRSSSAEDHTVLASARTTIKGAKRETSSKTSSISSLTILIIVFLAMLVGAGVVGYLVAQGETNAPEKVPADVGMMKPALPQVAAHVPPPEVLPKPEAKTTPVVTPVAEAKKEPAPVFGQAEFEKAVTDFRAGKKTAACASLSSGVKIAKAGVWREKAKLFVERRCK